MFNPELRAKMLGEGESWEREESSSSDEEGKKHSKVTKRVSRVAHSPLCRFSQISEKPSFLS